MSPQLAQLSAEPPEGDAWLHEAKLDGYRVLGFLAGGSVRLLTRGGNDWTDRFPAVARALADLPIEEAVVDGEVVVLDERGVSDFQALQNSLEARRMQHHVLFAFDLPHAGGFDLRAVPLEQRKELLARLLRGRGRTRLRYSEHVVGEGELCLRQACELGLEGIISKRRNAPYEERRSSSWIKTKCLRRQEFVIGGWTEPAGAREHLGALLLGTHERNGELRYAGKVGTGFSARSLASLAQRLAPLAVSEPPFADPPRGAEARGAHWVAPRLVAEIAFTEWTSDGRVRHPSFQGLREDKRAPDVTREEPKRRKKPKKKMAARRKTSRSRPARRRTARPAQTTRATARASESSIVAGVPLSSPERVLWPEQGLTKLELAQYYQAVAERLLPHVVDRPLMLVRCPRGRAARCFYQKHVGEGMGPPVRAIPVEERGGKSECVGVDDLEGIVTLVQLGTLEFHAWGSRADRLERPDRIVLDLDPGPEVAWARVVAAAHALRELVSALGLESFVRTTGGKGLHVVLPIARRSSWSEAKDFALDMARALARGDPDGFVLTSAKAQRRSRIFVDYLRNDRGSTAVASYSARAREGAPVAAPLGWDELTARLDPQRFTVRTVPERLAARRDPWAGFFDVEQSLTRAVRARAGKL